MKKKDILNLFLLTLPLIVIIILCTYPNYLFGSVTDWITQHTVFPEYFRTLFYKTGDLFPDFMFNLGAGQNIYYVSYYGLLNPFIIISYLFPFIKMIDYMMILNILLVLSSCYLYYYWLIKRGVSRNIVFVTSFIFLFSAPLLFHSHRHIMFISYMPFLLLGLVKIDDYFKNKKIALLTISICGMILTSYYYSIGGILVLIIYGIYCYLEKENKISFKKFMIDGTKFLIPIVLGILLSCFFLLPTAYVILNGRNGGAEPFTLKQLLFPKFDINALVYSSYSIGLSAISIFGLFHTFFTKKKDNIFLGITLTIILSLPIIMYSLNGFLYIRSKVLIPFLPLFTYLIACFLKDLKYNKNLKYEIIIFILFIIYCYLTNYKQVIFFIDSIICIIYLCSYYKWNKKWIYMIPIIIISISSAFIVNKQEKYQSKREYQNAISNNKIELIENVLTNDNSFYRMNDLTDTMLSVNEVYSPNYYTTSLYSSTFNQPYKDFFYNNTGNVDTYRNRLVMSSSNNIFFQTLMNIKYVIAKKNSEPVGYSLIEEKDNYGIYKNDNVYPLGYVTNNLYSKEYYNSLSFPYNIELLMNGIVVEDGKEEYEFATKKYPSIIYNKNIEGVSVKKIDNGYKVKVNKGTKFNIPLQDNLSSNQILIITFEIPKSQSCNIGDLTISINGQSNKLTCKQWMYHNENFKFEYVISANKTLDNLSIYMSKGTFEIVNIKSYVLDYNTFKDNTSLVDSFNIDTEKTKGDKIIGSIDVKKDGYFILSIPYDKGFKIRVDGKNRSYEKVNEVFIGFPLEKGNHNIEIIYEAPYKKIGCFISVISLIFLIFISLNEFDKGSKK